VSGADGLTAVPGVGPQIAESVAKFAADAANRRILRRLAAAGVLTTEPEADRRGPLAGKTFVLTGTLDRLTREEAHALIEHLGGRTGDTVSARTDAVVVGAAPGSKLDDARRLGIRTMDEPVFLALVRAG
jgi:DNA ligase (NAD+)